MAVPRSRVRAVNDAPVRDDGDFVLYWMIAARRTRWSFAFDRAVDHARALGKPLVVLEALRVGYRWASARLHRFVLDGMADNAAALEKTPVLYYPYVEPKAGAGKGLLEALSQRAAVVVTDAFPAFFLPRMVAAAGRKLPVRLEAVDGNGLLPLSTSGRTFPTAYVFRRFLQKELPHHLAQPRANPLEGAALPRLSHLPDDIERRWPRANEALLGGDEGALRALPIDPRVKPAPLRGGPRTAERALRRFLDERLPRYGTERSLPDAQADSQLSPFLHFGHLSAHEVVAYIERYRPHSLL